MRSFFSGLRQFWAVALALTLLAGSACWAGELELSPTEQTWLDAHPVIRMSVDAGYGPYTFLDAKRHLQGMAIEFFADIERLLGVRFEIVSNLSWSQQMQAVRERRLDAVATVVKLPEREAFLEFTEIYLPTPLVIMTRNETPQLHSLKELQQLRLSLVKGFSSSKQLTAQFPSLRPRYVTTPLEGLRLVASGATDAYVGALGVNSFLAARNGITNLKVNAAFNMEDNGQRFGVRKDWPQLARLLNKALLAISEERRDAIFQRWLPRHTSEIKRLSRPNYVTRLFPWLLGGLGLALLGYLVTLLWNRQLKKELARRSADLERAQTIAHLGDWSMEVKSGRIHWSDELYRIAGRAPQFEALDWSVLREWVHQDEREQHDRFLQQLSRSRPGDSLPPLISQLLRPDGDSRWLEITSAVEFNAAKQPVRFYGTAQDISERKQAEEALRDREVKFSSIFNQSPIGIELYDSEGNLVNANPKCLEIFGVRNVEAVKGFKLFEDPNISSEVKKRLLAGESVSYESEFDFDKVRESELYETSKTGKIFVEIFAVPWEIGALDQKAFLVHVTDITARKQAEEELEKHRERLEELVRERTAELEAKNTELERMNDLFVGREFRIKELSDRVKELELKIEY
jgi:PAS domain S-box-containing protein